MKKRSLLVSSVMTMMLCGSLIAGATYSLFTSESTHDITVSSGTVDVRSTLLPDTLTTTSLGVNQTKGEFANGGTATIAQNGKDIVLDKMTPGDKVSIDINIKNLSTVTTKYRVVVKCKDGFKLFGALLVNYDAQTDFKTLLPIVGENPGVTTTCTIELPEETNDEYQGLSTVLSISVEALQGNAPLPNIIDNSFAEDTGTKAINKVSPAPVTVTTNKGAASVTVPVTRQDSINADDIGVTVTSTKETGNFTFTDDVYSSYYDINVTGIVPKESNSDKITVTMFIGKGLTNVKVYHEVEGQSVSISSPSYDTTTGFVTFETDSFSLYAITADKVSNLVALDTVEATTANFVQAFKDYSTVTLGGDITLNSTPKELVSIDKDTVLNLNGHKITFNVLDNATNETSLFKVNDAKFTINPNNGTIESVLSDSNIKTSLVYIDHANASAKLGEGSYFGSPYIVKANEGLAEASNGVFDLSTSYKTVAPITSNEIFYRVPNLNSDVKEKNIKLSKGKFINFNPYKVDSDYQDNACFILPKYFAFAETNELNETVYTSKFINDFDVLTKNKGKFTFPGDMFLTAYLQSSNLCGLRLSSGTYDIDIGEYDINLCISTSEALRGGKRLLNVILVDGWSASNVTISGTTGVIDASKVPGIDTVYAMDVYNSKAEVYIKGGNFIGLDSAIQVEKGKAFISGGTFDMSEAGKKLPTYADKAKYIVNCIDSAFEQGTAKIEMTGGTIIGYNPLDNPEGDGTNKNPAAGVVYGAHAYVPVGYKTIETSQGSGNYQVVPE